MFSLEYQCVFQNLLLLCFVLFCFVLLYNKSLTDWFIGENWIFVRSNLNVFFDFVSGNKIHCSPGDQSLSVKYNLSVDYKILFSA